MKITLEAWATRNFDPAPKIATLRGWAQTGRISPSPVNVGRAYMVDEDAVYCAPGCVEALTGRVAEILARS